VAPVKSRVFRRSTGEITGAIGPARPDGGGMAADLRVLRRVETPASPRAEHEKRVAAEAAAALAEDGMAVGLGTGSTVAHFLPALAARGLDIWCVATSARTEEAARRLGLEIVRFDALDRLDLAVDGADQIAPTGWLVKGGGAAHTREKVVAAAADRFVVIASSDKLVERLTPPVPVELLPFGAEATLAAIGSSRRRAVPPSPDGGLIADYFGPVDEPAVLAHRLAALPGVIEHGLFGPDLIHEILVAHGDEVERKEFR
jgi:ribose 5-phosphate isomerase A